jgi:hypothetical protein
MESNAGDGKTAFIQKVDNLAKARSAVFNIITDNGCLFSLLTYLCIIS